MSLLNSVLILAESTVAMATNLVVASTNLTEILVVTSDTSLTLTKAYAAEVDLHSATISKQTAEAMRLLDID